MVWLMQPRVSGGSRWGKCDQRIQPLEAQEVQDKLGLGWCSIIPSVGYVRVGKDP